MATTVTRYVNPDSPTGGNGTTSSTDSGDSNRAYNSLSEWNEARKRNLTTADEVEEVICDSNGTADTTTCNIDDTWVTDATRYISIKSAANSRPGSAYSTSKYRIEHATRGIHIGGGDYWVRIDGLQVKITSSTAGSAGIEARTCATPPSSAKVLIENCVIYTPNFSTNASAIDIFEYSGEIRRCILYCDGTAIGVHCRDAVVNVWNCTFHDQYYGIFNYASSSTGTQKNCGFDSVPEPNGFTATTCSSTSPTFVDAANNNFHLADADTTWKDAGTDLSADWKDFAGNTYTPKDIDGETVSGTWDIGADEWSPGPVQISVADCSEAACRL